jgi:hypothetical protein
MAAGGFRLGGSVPASQEERTSGESVQPGVLGAGAEPRHHLRGSAVRCLDPRGTLAAIEASGKSSTIKMVSFNGSSLALQDVPSQAGGPTAYSSGYGTSCITGFYKLWGLPAPK